MVAAGGGGEGVGPVVGYDEICGRLWMNGIKSFLYGRYEISLITGLKTLRFGGCLIVLKLHCNSYDELLFRIYDC